ncbi:hypothetical protein IEQ34_010298 [Dendrobium chrysotoxum]|uniref:Uncharacterized protein n=1 Tax=Dendrobium chrysotoxum TaxID=161865 RepID=A0AAV7H507_DENCH|nr:hypothetical protein IEQ34_010298 [Dendrobium chrysotoxum]
MVGKFSNRKTTLDSIRRFFFNLKLNGDFYVTVLNPKHMLIKLVNNLDYSRMLNHPISRYEFLFLTYDHTCSPPYPPRIRIAIWSPFKT